MGHKHFLVEGRLNFLFLIRPPFDDRALLSDVCECLNFYGFPHRPLTELRKQIRDGFVMVGMGA
jgi:hypothetical protein